ncbi:hypothetical protein ACVNF4_36355, partial [Streptomyces sp. S6]
AAPVEPDGLAEAADRLRLLLARYEERGGGVGEGDVREALAAASVDEIFSFIDQEFGRDTGRNATSNSREGQE